MFTRFFGANDKRSIFVPRWQFKLSRIIGLIGALRVCFLITKRLPMLSKDHATQPLGNFMVITIQGNVPVPLDKNIFAILLHLTQKLAFDLSSVASGRIWR